MKVISLGWGVQSFTLAAMCAQGDLEPIDVAIHADTTHESQLTYDFAAHWMSWLEEREIKVVTVTPRGARVNPLNYKKTNAVMIPAFTDTVNDGMLRRQCTDYWKIAPIRRWLQVNRDNKPVEQWLGISLDEFQRMRRSDVKYITNRWPLIEKRMTRHDCIIWLEKHGLEIPPKSACIFCPFHNTAEWRHIKTSQVDWQKAVAFDCAIRKARPPHDLFIHSSRKPLMSVDLRTQEEKGQLRLWNEECTGLCGV